MQEPIIKLSGVQKPSKKDMKIKEGHAGKKKVCSIRGKG